MKRKYPATALTLLLISSMISCGSGIGVGSGANLSTLPSEPTASDLAQGIYDSLAQTTQVSRNETQTATTKKEEVKVNCINGGSFNTVATSPILSTEEGTFHISFNDCSVLVTILGKEYKETINGVFDLDLTSSSATVGVSLSLSGDLGLGVSCKGKDTKGSTTSTGECIFKDNSGKEIKGPIEGIININL